LKANLFKTENVVARAKVNQGKGGRNWGLVGDSAEGGEQKESSVTKASRPRLEKKEVKSGLV